MNKLLTAIIKLLLVSTLSAHLNSSKDEKRLRSIIEPLNEKLINSIMEDDLETYLSLYTDDAVIMLPFISTINGRNALTVHWHNNMAKGKYIESATTTTIDIWEAGNLIYERGQYQITYVKIENKPRAIYGSYFSIWAKQNDGTYKMKNDIANLDYEI